MRSIPRAAWRSLTWLLTFVAVLMVAASPSTAASNFIVYDRSYQNVLGSSYLGTVEGPGGCHYDINGAVYYSPSTGRSWLESTPYNALTESNNCLAPSFGRTAADFRSRVYCVSADYTRAYDSAWKNGIEYPSLVATDIAVDPLNLYDRCVIQHELRTSGYWGHHEDVYWNRTRGFSDQYNW